MKTISKIEQEVNQIKHAIYEETKDITTAEREEYYRKSGETTAIKYGFKTIENSKARMVQ